MDTVDLGIEAGTRADGTMVVGGSVHSSTGVNRSLSSRRQGRYSTNAVGEGVVTIPSPKACHRDRLRSLVLPRSSVASIRARDLEFELGGIGTLAILPGPCLDRDRFINVGIR